MVLVVIVVVAVVVVVVVVGSDDDGGLGFDFSLLDAAAVADDTDAADADAFLSCCLFLSRARCSFASTTSSVNVCDDDDVGTNNDDTNECGDQFDVDVDVDDDDDNDGGDDDDPVDGDGGGDVDTVDVDTVDDNADGILCIAVLCLYLL